MLKRLSVAATFVSTLAIAAAYGSAFLPGGAPPWAPWALAIGLAGCLVGVMALGAARQGRLGRLGPVFGFVFAVLVLGFGAALGLPAVDPAEPTLWLGLPPRAAIILYGIGFLPLLVVPVAYALSFEEQTLRPEDLERIRHHRTAAARRAAARVEVDDALESAAEVGG